MTERLQVVVDEDDQQIGVATREEAWAKGLISRHVYIVIRDPDGNFLLQQRCMKKKSNPGKWTWAATGHVDAGESYDEAAKRELLEEVGLQSKIKLLDKIRTSHTNKYGLVDCFISVYTGTISRDEKITVEPDEVERTKWFSPDELHALVTDTPDLVTHNMKTTYREFFS